jgi:solute carrier family 35 protein E1
MQTVKSSVPAFSVLLSTLLLGENFSTRIYISIFLVVAGVALSTFTELEFNTIGFVCAILASVANALQALLTGILLSGENRLDSINLLYNMAPLSAFMLLPFSLVIETFGITGEPSWIFDWKHQGTWYGIGMLLASGTIAFCLNYSSLLVVRYTSPLASNVAGNFKVVLSIFFSVLLFGTVLTPLNAFGCVVALVGVGAYNYFKFQEAQAGITKH